MTKIPNSLVIDKLVIGHYLEIGLPAAGRDLVIGHLLEIGSIRN